MDFEQPKEPGDLDISTQAYFQRNAERADMLEAARWLMNVGSKSAKVDPGPILKVATTLLHGVHPNKANCQEAFWTLSRINPNQPLPRYLAEAFTAQDRRLQLRQHGE